MLKLDVKPGDLLEWVLTTNGRIVKHDLRWFFDHGQLHGGSIGSFLIHLCIAYDHPTIIWLNERGLFHANLNLALEPDMELRTITCNKVKV